MNPTLSLPPDLTRCIEAGKVLPVIGAGYPDWVSVPPPFPLRAPSSEAADIHWIEEWIIQCRPRVTVLHELISDLSGAALISFTPDPGLESLLRTRDEAWVTLRFGQGARRPDSRIHIPLVGTLNDPDTLALTEKDYLCLDRSALWLHAQGQAAQYPLLVLGCSPSDRLLLGVLAELRPRPPFEKAGWLFCRQVEAADRRAWEGFGFSVVECHPARTIRLLAAARRESGAQLSLGEMVSGSGNPYKRLEYFERYERDIFFGRDEDIERLADLVHAHRLVVVTGPSGAGKTSLINTGLLADADRGQEKLGVYVRVGDDPVASLTNALRQFIPGEWRAPTDLNTLLRDVRDATHRIPLVILDQAEELFTRTATPLFAELARSLREIVLASPLVARVVLCLRDDYLARLVALREWIPSALQNVFYLGELGHEASILAIRGPAEKRGVPFDPELAENIARELGVTSVAPPQIQIVCNRLFEAAAGGSIDFGLYRSQGGAQTILRNFLAEQLNKTGDSLPKVRMVMKSLVTAEGTKEPVTEREVARRSKLSIKTAREILLDLRDGARLLRGVQVGRENCFELTHEYLTSEIWSWMSAEDIRKREAEGMLQREIRSWRRFRQLRLGLDRLSYFFQVRRLLELNGESLALLLLSSIKHAHSASQWTAASRKVNPQEQGRIIETVFEYFAEKDVRQRREAAEVIAAIDPTPLRHFLGSDVAFRKLVALEMIGGIEWAGALSDILLIAESSTNIEVVVKACRALGEIGGPEALKVLSTLAKGHREEVAVSAIEAIGRLRTPDAASALKEALASDRPKIVKAALAGVSVSRDPSIAIRLIRDSGFSSEPRDQLWSSISRCGPVVLNGIRLVLPQLDVDDIRKARKIPAIENAALEALARRKGTPGEEARIELRSAKKAERSEQRQAAKLRLGSTAEDVLKHIKSNECGWETYERISELSPTIALIEELIRNADQDVKIAGWAALNYRVEAPNGLDPLLQDGLLSRDSTIRYLACRAIGNLGRASLSEGVEELIDDFSESTRWYVEIGATVEAAAGWALDRLRPTSKVWRKPFLERFKGPSKA